MYSGFFSVKVSTYSRRLMDEWFDLCSDPKLMMRDIASELAEHPEMWSHKEDQSVLSLLIKREMIKSYPAPVVGYDRSDMTAIAAGYCSPGVISEALIYPAWRDKKWDEWNPCHKVPLRHREAPQGMIPQDWYNAHMFLQRDDERHPTPCSMPSTMP